MGRTPMITPSYVRTMTAYNTLMNRQVYAAAAGLEDAVRRADRGAFWGSIQGTLNHLLWGDHMWMARFADWPRPDVAIADSGRWHADFDALGIARVETDDRITAWAEGVSAEWLADDLSWHSVAAGRSLTQPRDFLVMHFFNHQTHHRGQVTALLTAAGADPGVTDLPFLLQPVA